MAWLISLIIGVVVGAVILLYLKSKITDKNEYDELDRKIDEEDRKTYSEMGPGIYFRNRRFSDD